MRTSKKKKKKKKKRGEHSVPACLISCLSFNAYIYLYEIRFVVKVVIVKKK
jgi:hypothetical protein